MEVEKIQFTRQLERAQVAQLQLKQDLANQQVQAQLRIAQVGETAHRDTAQLTQSNDMLKTASTHLASNVRQALDTAEGMADDVAALEDHLKKVGAVQEVHMPAPASGFDRSLTDGEKADFLVKLMSHVRLHFLYLAEKLQEQLAAPEGEMAAAASGSGQVTGQMQSLTLSQQEKELRVTVSKLVHTEQAQEALYTCMACVSLLKNPVVCTPCGHTFCYGCLMKGKTVGGELACSECNNLPITGYVENRALEGLVTKYEYRMGALKALQRMLK
ncbi:MAG: hypothetical protein FRX49_03565 [Trebouxia sp. A1-2]|nr:MAG: hypothetical protein FRX49_03565 [Trebouxia sp. A1-2]